MAYDGSRPEPPPRNLGSFDLSGAIILAAIIIAVPWIGIPLVVLIAFWGSPKKRKP